MTSVSRVGEATVRAESVARTEAVQRRRIAVFFGLLVALAIGASLLWPQRRQDPWRRVRTSQSDAADSFRALYELAARLGYPTKRLRASYARLPAPGTATLVCLDPLPADALARVHDAALAGQLDLAAAWVHDGGHLLVTWPGRDLSGGEEPLPATPVGDDDLAAAVFDPLPAVQWIPAAGNLVGTGALREVRLPWPRVPPRAMELGEAFLQTERGEDAPRLQAFAEPLPEGCRPLLSLAGAPVVIERRVGGGRVWAASTPLLFSTLALAEFGSGHAALALLHDASEGGRRHLLFDEFAHGLREHRGVLWFVWHGPLFHPVAGMLLVLVVLAWRGAVRLGPPLAMAVTARRAKEEFVLGVADLEARAGHARAAAAALLRDYRRDPLVSRDAERAGRLAALEPLLDKARPFGDKDLVAFAARIDLIVTDEQT